MKGITSFTAAGMALCQNPKGLHWVSPTEACHSLHNASFCHHKHPFPDSVCWIVKPKQHEGSLCLPHSTFLLWVLPRAGNIPCQLVQNGAIFLGVEYVASRNQRGLPDAVYPSLWQGMQDMASIQFQLYIKDWENDHQVDLWIQGARCETDSSQNAITWTHLI